MHPNTLCPHPNTLCPHCADWGDHSNVALETSEIFTPKGMQKVEGATFSPYEVVMNNIKVQNHNWVKETSTHQALLCQTPFLCTEILLIIWQDLGKLDIIKDGKK